MGTTPETQLSELLEAAEQHLDAWRAYSKAVQQGEAKPLEITGAILKADARLKRAIDGATRKS